MSRARLVQDRQLRVALDRVKRRKQYRPLVELRRGCQGGSADARLRSLLTMRRQILEKGLRNGYFDLAKGCVEDLDNNCRWQALILIGEFTESRAEAVWRIAEKYGLDENEDMRAAVATVLLEHLIAHHAKYRRRAEKLAGTDERFRQTLDMCWDFTTG